MNKQEREEIVQKAREANLLDYFRQSGYKVKQEGAEFYVTDIPGLCIKPDTNQWYHHYTSYGSTNNSLNCLVYVIGMDFNQAVYELTGKDLSQTRSYSHFNSHPHSSAPRTTSMPVAKKELQMPPQAKTDRQMLAYMCKTRRIPQQIVKELEHKGLLYQADGKANAVFVHKDREGKVIGGEIQGCNSFKRYKSLAVGTGDSAFMFVPVPAKDGKIRRAYIFESAIDLMSFYAFCHKDSRAMVGAALVSMAGLKPTVPKRLQAEGIEIISCVDNDDAGRRFEADNGFIRPQAVKEKLDKFGFKDWNEMLVFKSADAQADISVQQTEQQQEQKHFFKRRG